MKNKFSSLVAALLLAGTTLQGASLNGFCVYLEYQVMARTMAPRHWYFLPDGRYLNDAPQEELTPQGLERGCAKYPDSCGTYEVAGAKLNLTPRKGKAWSTDFKPPANGNYEISGIPCQIVKSTYPANSKLNGTYTSGSGFGGVSSASTYVFSPDGSYTYEAVGSVRTGGASATSASAKRGAYNLLGNTLTLSSEGKTTRHLIYEIPAGAGTQMMIDGYSWKKN